MSSYDVRRNPTFAGGKLGIDGGDAHPKKTRSRIPRRKRDPALIPLQFGASDPFISGNNDESDASSCFRSGISTASSLRRTGAGRRIPRSPPRGPSTSKEEITGESEVWISEDSRRPVTRWYSRQQKRRRTEEISAISAVKAPPEISAEASSCLESVADAPAERIVGAKPEMSEASTSVGQKPGVVLGEEDLHSDFACSEMLLEWSTSEQALCDDISTSDFESQLFSIASEGDSSSCCASTSFDSDEDSSGLSGDDGSAPPSLTYSLFLYLVDQFTPLEALESPSTTPEQLSTEFVMFDEDDEESYRRLRAREKKEAAMSGFTDIYSSTVYGRIVLQQRWVMVNWMAQRAKSMELHSETLFLAVSLMDRFLGRGYFGSLRNQQLLGIACTTLATRLEENQLHNSARRRRPFVVDGEEYTRPEVVAMEWLIMEVLKFQCLYPTVHNFLWFYLKAARANGETELLARNLAELSLQDHVRLGFWPSTVAASIVILASLATGLDSASNLVMEVHIRTKDDGLPQCIESLEWLVNYPC